jgi:hypothetical protein
MMRAPLQYCIVRTVNVGAEVDWACSQGGEGKEYT